MKDLRKRENMETDSGAATNGDSDMAAGNFDNFPISSETKKNLQNTGIQYLFPIQAKTFNPIFQGKDLIGKDRTGSGKTLAFLLPLLEKMREGRQSRQTGRGQTPQLLVLVPTRELCLQVTKELDRFKNSQNEFRSFALYGGTDIYQQIDQLRNGADIVIGTPGRIIDLMNRGVLSYKALKYFILDETDQMLNIGFQEDIENILKKLSQELEEVQRTQDSVQFLLFSATIPRWIENIANKFMKPDLVRVDMVKGNETKTSKTVDHLSLFFPSRDHKIEAIGDLVLVYGGVHSRTIIFTDTKDEANKVLLKGQMKVECQVLHGDIPQKQREVTFTSFRNGSLKCLVATNVAARGLDIPEVDLIVQLSPPKEIETYIHRSGRTGRAGKGGTCITFYTRKENELMDRIENHAKMRFRKIGAPQPSDIMRSNARDISCSFDNVSSDVLVYFQENVKSILAKYSPDEAICRALAVISGYTKTVQQRSLLFSVEGYVTYLMEIDREVHSSSYFWNLLRKHFSPAITNNIKGMRFLKSHKGVIFDLKQEDQKLFDEIVSNIDIEGLLVEPAKELPEFEERNDFNQGYGGGNRDNGYGYGQGRNGFSLSRRNDNDGPRYGFTNSNGTRGFGKAEYSNNRDSNNAPGQGKDDCKLFVANLPFEFVENNLHDFCEGKGIKPVDIYIVKDQERKSKGYGYVKFPNSGAARDAMSELSRSRIQGRSIRVDYADRR